MNGWYQTKNSLDGSDIVINLDNVSAIISDKLNGSAVFVMNRPNCIVHSVEKYSDVLRKLFGPDESEEGEDDGKPREDPSGFGGMLPM